MDIGIQEEKVEKVIKKNRFLGGKKKWLWAGLSILAAGILASASSGSGGGDGNGDEDNDRPPPSSGDITIQWN